MLSLAVLKKLMVYFHSEYNRVDTSRACNYTSAIVGKKRLNGENIIITDGLIYFLKIIIFSIDRSVLSAKIVIIRRSTADVVLLYFRSLLMCRL